MTHQFVALPLVDALNGVALAQNSLRGGLAGQLGVLGGENDTNGLLCLRRIAGGNTVTVITVCRQRRLQIARAKGNRADLRIIHQGGGRLSVGRGDSQHRNDQGGCQSHVE